MAVYMYGCIHACMHAGRDLRYVSEILKYHDTQNVWQYDTVTYAGISIHMFSAVCEIQR